MSYTSTCLRYRKFRDLTREQLEEEALHAYQRRIDVVTINDDILRRARRDWYAQAARQVDWDWDAIMYHHWRSSARCFQLALLVRGQLCGLMAARVSHRKRWISLTHVEGHPGEHPLKGLILPLAVNALYIYRGVICGEKVPERPGIRILNPLEEALTCYKANGYTLSNDSKRLRSIEIEAPIVFDYSGDGDENGSEDGGGPSAQDGADSAAGA